MELVEHDVPLSEYKEPVYLHCFSDIHRSAVGCDVKKLHKDIESIRKGLERGEKHFWFGGGDFNNSIGARDKRFDHTQVRREFSDYSGDDLHQQEARTLATEFEPIKHVCLGIGTGNHERAVAKYNDFNSSIYLAERLNVPYLGYSALMRLTFRLPHGNSIPCLIHFHHGMGAARTRASKVKAMEHFRDVVTNADLYFSGHTHEWIDFPSVRMEGSRRGAFQLQQREIMFVNSGTYLKAYPTTKKPQKGGKYDPTRIVHVDYAEMAAYTPNVIGHNGVVIQVHHCGSSQPSFRLKFERFKSW